MNAIFKFVAGNSRVTPAGVAVAVGTVFVFVHRVPWIGPVYLGLLLLTLVISTFERV